MFLRASARDAIIAGHLVSLSEEESAECDTTDSDCNGGWTEGGCECFERRGVHDFSLFHPVQTEPQGGDCGYGMPTQ